jgi:hypothetical protein
MSSSFTPARASDCGLLVVMVCTVTVSPDLIRNTGLACDQ